jgi:anti-sigma B factor antagonist
MGARDDHASFAIAQRGDVVLLSGEMDLAARDELHVCLDGVDAPDGRLVVDLTEVSFIDSSGIEALCSARRRLARDGGTVVLRGPSAIVMRALEVTGVAPLFEIDVPDAAPSPGTRER